MTEKLQNLLQNLRKHLRVSLSSTRFHTLSDEESEEVLFPGLIFCNLSRIVGEDFLGDRFEGSSVGNLAELLRIHDGVGSSSVQEEFLYDYLCIG